MTRVLVGLYTVAAVAFAAANLYLSGTLATGDVTGFFGIS